MPKTIPSKRAIKSTSNPLTSSGKRPSKSVSLGSDRKRRASSSTVSSLSSVTSMEGLSDEDDDANDSEDADDEDDQPILLTPSYRNHKAGMKSAKRAQQAASDDDSEHEISDGPDLEDSSDDVYAAVDYISDGDDEEQDVEILEELMILESEDEHELSSAANTGASEVHDWAGPSVFNDDLMFTGAPFFDEQQLYSAMEAFGETDVASETAVETPVPRRVHFEEDSDSSSDSDSYTEDEIPSDFLQQDSLDPQLRRMIESDSNEVGRRSSRRQSDEIYADSDYGHSNIYHVESDGAVSEGSSSGYETDDGETTDEDLPPPATITHPRSILRRDSSASLAAAIEEKTEPTPRRRRGPLMGTFVADPHKPVALVDCTGKHLVIIPAYASSRHDWLESAATSVCGTANNSPRATTMHLIDESDTDALISPNMDLSPMLASSANLMMTALGNDVAPGGQVMGPPEAFYPSRDFAIDSSFEDEDEDEDPEAQLNVDDFIDFGGDSSDEELDKESDEEAMGSPMTVVPVGSTNGTPTPNRGADPHQTNSAERFLNHLDRGIVTAFRRNHNRYQALLRLPQHREFMPANSPSRPASVFRHARHADQRTPTRKRKASGNAGGEAVRRKLMNAQRHSQLPF
ncbi:uncharacterized protein DSM5745_03510 [Aspergillus mulundensis]|uniref:Uncharacterized protein n=1 Tax=Aspergillus mulundensis TaxID=1810919 RepID=A0A3D8SM33_9EURO|nr:Uncharacterized protein DSM5745_03510 [Aspergillus mulundensis]RDW86868.1 Uncharacterized protein DSM5745_03510 [Aspergillus mulundensis]